MVIISIWRDPQFTLNAQVIPIHPTVRSTPQIYPYYEGISKVDWDTLDLPFGERDYHNDEIRHKCMAECLIPKGIAPENFAYIYVQNQQAKMQIEQMPYFSKLKYPVNVNANMFPPV